MDLIRPSSTSISTSVATCPSHACSACQTPDPLMSRLSLYVHGNVDASLARNLERALVAGVGMPHDASAGVVGQYALELRRRRFAAVGHDDHARVDRAADSDPPAVMHAHP